MPHLTFLGHSLSNYCNTILTPDVLNFVLHMEEMFKGRRKDILNTRVQRQNDGVLLKSPRFFPTPNSDWKVVDAPADLQDRRVEITGPTDRKMMIHAFNSGAKVFMADMEDACSPSWNNILEGHYHLNLAVRRELDFTSEDGKAYKLKDKIATLILRPRGWHLSEKHILLNGEEISASLFDFAVYFYHNAKTLIEKGSGPYFYLPKMESHLEARLWKDVFEEAERYLGIPKSSIRVTALIETIPAAFEMEAILYELRSYIIGLNAGRWDYIFSFIKNLGISKKHIFPDRQFVTMAVPFMRAYAQLMVQVCHRRGAHAIGGMSAFIPNRKNPEWNEKAFAAVRADKRREADDGFDGTWVAHPDLVPVALEVFNSVLGTHSHQKHILREDLLIKPEDLLVTEIPNAQISLNGFKNNIRIALQYMGKWLSGLGAVAIDQLMEDTATAEISRAQIWQWLHHQCLTHDGTKITASLYQKFKEEALSQLQSGEENSHYEQASRVLDELVLSEKCPDFLTIPAYRLLS